MMSVYVVSIAEIVLALFIVAGFLAIMWELFEKFFRN
jgi:hypothetical protein